MNSAEQSSEHTIDIVLDTAQPKDYDDFTVNSSDRLTVDGMESDAKSVRMLFYRLLGSASDGIYSPSATLRLDHWTVPTPWRLTIRDRKGALVRREIYATTGMVVDTGRNMSA